MFFYHLGLVLDSLVFGLGLGHWTHQIFWLVSTESRNLCFFFFKAKALIWLACSENGHFPVAQLVEHGASNAKITGSIPRESKS